MATHLLLTMPSSVVGLFTWPRWSLAAAAPAAAWLDRWTAPLLLETILAATLLLLAALAINGALRRSAASLRHRVWALAVLGLLAYPLAQPLLPKFSLGLPMAAPVDAARAERLATSPEISPAVAAQSPSPALRGNPVEAIAANARRSFEPRRASAAPAADVPGAQMSPAAPPGRALLTPWPSLLAALWAAGTAIGIAALLAVQWAAWQFVRTATVPVDPSWSELAGKIAALLSIRRCPAVRVSARLAVPVTAGWLRPVVLLPAECDQWSVARRRMVLMHEMSHVARGDVLWQIAAKLACALYWPHPLVWLAARRMRVEREAACDDAVLRDVARPSEYAALLLDVATSLVQRPTGTRAAVAMASRGSVEERILWIVQPGRCRLPLGRQTARWFSIGALLIVLGLGSIRLFAGPPAPAATEPATDQERLVAAVSSGDFSDLRKLVLQIAEHDGQKSIPLLIGVMDADNSQEAVYDVGYFGLRRLVPGVEWSPFHDGPWWRRWWQAHKQEFPDEVQAIPIPDLKKTAQGKRSPTSMFPYGERYTPFPEDIDTLQGELKLAAEVLAGEKSMRETLYGHPRMALWLYAQEVAKHDDPHAIPYLIGLVIADKAAIDHVGSFGLKPLTGVDFDSSHDGAWWQQWWRDNKSKYPADVQAIEIPDYKSPLTFAWKEPSEEEKRQIAERKKREALADVADVPSLDLTADGNKKMRYFLVGPRKDAHPPKDGYKLVVVMPGGDGSEAFHPFIRRLYKHAMTEDYLVAQPVAVRWTPMQQIVWPTKTHPERGQEFSTEEFVEAVIKDVSQRQPIDKRFVFTLSWSSSGPAAYSIALQEKTAVTGSYIAMSVFRPMWLPPVEPAKGRVFLIEHSPQDKTCPYADAQKAQRELLSAGANVRLVDYEGGHGWHGQIYGRVGDGLSWLVRQLATDGAAQHSVVEPAKDAALPPASDGQKSGQEPSRRTELEHRQSSSATTVQNSPWRVALPNGAAVEVIGLAPSPSDEKPWWQPDGSPLLELPFMNNRKSAVNNKNRRTIDIAYRVTWPDSGPSASKIRIPSNLGIGVNDTMRGKEGISGVTVVFPADKATTDIYLGAAAGPWELAVTLGPRGGKCDRSDLPNAEFKSVEQRNGEFVAEGVLSWEWDDQFDYRLVVAGEDGTEHVFSYRRARDVTPEKKVRHWTFHDPLNAISEHPLTAVKEMRLEYRRYQFAAFKHVSLRPSVKTQAQVVVITDAEADIIDGSDRP